MGSSPQSPTHPQHRLQRRVLAARRHGSAPAGAAAWQHSLDLEEEAAAHESDALAAAHAENIGLECHAGHGLGFDTVGPVAAIPAIVELNIGHSLIGEGIFMGLAEAIRRMRELMDEARASA